MTSDAKTVEEYLSSLDERRQPAMRKIDSIVTTYLSGSYSRNMQYGMISYTIPHSVYPGGYHCKPSDEVPFLSVASQKNYISIYHMGLYESSKLLPWLSDALAKAGIKPDIGKCCIRFKKIDLIPYDIIKELVDKSTIDEYVKYYRAIDPRNKTTS